MIIRENEAYSGTQVIHKFDNGYGASVVCHAFSYGGKAGLSEIAVIKFNDSSDDDWQIVYNTDITDDVIGNLTDEGVEEILKQIEAIK